MSCRVIADRRVVRIYRILLEIENGMSSTKEVEYASIEMTGWNLKDAKFVDDEECMLAMANESK